MGNGICTGRFGRCRGALLKLALERRGFAVWEALELYRRNRDEIDVVLLDVQMPGPDGPQTLAALQQLNPDVLACFMTGDAGTYTESDLLARGALHVFNKPFSASGLAMSVHALLLAATETANPDRVLQRRSGRNSATY